MASMTKRRYVSEETRRRISVAKTGQRYPFSAHTLATSDEERAAHRRNAWRSFAGGITGEYYASLLCPLGYTREHHTYVNKRHYVLDFAELKSKTNIEIDSPFHPNTLNDDTERDTVLRANGWRVIRIKDSI